RRLAPHLPIPGTGVKHRSPAHWESSDGAEDGNATAPDTWGPRAAFSPESPGSFLPCHVPPRVRRGRRTCFGAPGLPLAAGRDPPGLETNREATQVPPFSGTWTRPSAGDFARAAQASPQRARSASIAVADELHSTSSDDGQPTRTSGRVSRPCIG